MTKIGKTALVVVDVQQGFLDESWGPTTNHPGCETNVERLLQAWAERDLPVVVVRHDSGKPDSPLHPTHPGNALIAPVAGAPADLLVTKSVNSAFYGTPDLEAWLRAAGIDQIVVCGIQTNMCVETTARMGGNLGFDVVVRPRRDPNLRPLRAGRHGRAGRNPDAGHRHQPPWRGLRPHRLDRRAHRRAKPIADREVSRRRSLGPHQACRRDGPALDRVAGQAETRGP